MICQGSTCKGGRAECKSPALCRAMNAPIVRPSYLPRDQAEQSRTPAQLTVVDWAAIAFCIFIYLIALARIFQII